MKATQHHIEQLFQGRMPWDYELIWPSVLDEPYLKVAVQWNADDDWTMLALRLEFHPIS